MLRVAGVRQADMKGYSFAREDVNAPRARQRVRPDPRPGVHPRDEALRGGDPRGAGGGRPSTTDELYHILYDGTVMDERGQHRARRSGRGDRRGDGAAVLRPTWTRRRPSGSARRCSPVPTRVAQRRPARGRAARPRPGRDRAFRRIKGDELDRDPRRLVAASPVAQHANERAEHGDTASNAAATHSSHAAAPRAAVVAGVRPVGRVAASVASTSSTSST